MTDQTIEQMVKGQGRPDLRELIMRYYKYLPWVLLSIAFFIVAAYIKIRYSVPIYHVQSAMMIKNDVMKSGNKDDRLGELFMVQQTTNLTDEMDLLKSSPVIARVVRGLDLQTSYYNIGKIKSGFLYKESPIRLQIIQLADSVTGFEFFVTMVNDKQFTINKGKDLHYIGEQFKVNENVCALWINKKVRLDGFQSHDFSVRWEPLTAMARDLAGSIKIAQSNQYSSTLTLAMETENTYLGVDVLNTLMSVYDSLVIEDKNRIAFNTMNFIDTRLNSLKDSLGGVEDKLRIFMETNQTFDVQDQAKSYMDKIGDASKDIMTQEVQADIVSWLIQYLENPRNSYQIIPTSLSIEEPAFLQLASEYNKVQLEREANLKTTTAMNPLIKSLDASLEKLRQGLTQALRNVQQANLIARKSLMQRNTQLESRLKAIPGKSMHELSIQRQQQILQELYYFLLQKKLETSISSASTISNSKVVEPSVASEIPVKPNSKSLYITYALIGLIIPVSIIAVLEMFNDKVNNRAELQKLTEVPILGEIGHSEGDKSLVVASNSRRFISEQFRIIRSNFQYIIGKNETPVILVTSSFSGEGKSFISTNIAAVMALAGKKTVVMEFDIRKPKIVSGLDLKRKMGITNYIIGSSRFEDLPIKVEQMDNLYVIPCGPIPPNPAEILLNPRLTDLIQEAKKHFEVVILDTAPIGLVSDAITLAPFADCTLYIVRRGYTPRRLVNLIGDLYNNKKLPAISILLNDVKQEGGYYGGYYGGYGYYGYSYGKGGGYFDNEDLPNQKAGFWKRMRRMLTGKHN